MAQYYFDRLDTLAKPGQAVTTGVRGADADFYSRAPGLIFESNRVTNFNSEILLPVTAADVDIIMKLRVLRNGGQAFSNTGPGFLLRYQDAANHIYWSTRSIIDNSTSWAGLYKITAGLQEEASGAIVAVQPALFQWFYMRVKITGSIVEWAAWLDGDTQPTLTAFTSINLTNAPATGSVGIRVRQWPIISEIGYVAIGTAGDIPPTSTSKFITGVVKDSSGVLTARVIRLHDRPTGTLLAETTSDPVTGVYSLNCDWPEELQRVSLAELSGAPLYNDLIHRVIL